MKRRQRTVGVERVTLGALTRPRDWPGADPIDPPVRAARLSESDVALLLGQDGQPSRTVQRLINRVLRSFNQVPYDRSWLEPTDAGPVSALIEIAPGIGWQAGTLFDPRHSIPDIMAAAAIGRPIGMLISHPDIDPNSIMREPPPSRGLVSIDPEIVTLAVPRGPSAWLRRVRLILAARRTDNPVSVLAQAMAPAYVVLCCTSSHLAFASLPRMHGSTAGTWIMTLVAWTTFMLAQLAVVVAVDVLCGRIVSDATDRLLHPGRDTFIERAAHDRQAIMLLAEFRRRGFGVTGEPD